MHKPARRPVTKNTTYVAEIDAQQQTDLVEMQSIAKKNNKIRNQLGIIDVFSKIACAITILYNNKKAITTAFNQMFKTA